MALTTSTNGAATSAPADRRPPPAPATRRRRPLRALALVMVAAMGAAASAALVARAGEREAVLAMARTVAAGAVITDADLTIVEIAADRGLRPVPAGERSQVVGRTAAVTLVAGSLLTDPLVGDRLAPTPGTAVVAVVLSGSRLPPPSLRAGEQVQLVQTGGSASAAGREQAGALGTVLAAGRVLAVEASDRATAGVVVSVALDAAVAPTVAGAAAADRISLVVVPEEP